MLDNIILKQRKKIINKKNIWLDSKFLWMKNLSATKKGSIGEEIVHDYLTHKGFNNHKSKGVEYDLTHLNQKIEVKTSMLNDTGYFKFLQIRTKDSYTHVALLCIEPNFSKLFIIPKNKITNLKPQHNGKRGNSQTMYLGIKPLDLYNNYKKYEIV
jgi:hypothetical protein